MLKGRHRVLSSGAQVIFCRSMSKKPPKELVIDFSKNKITVSLPNIYVESVERVSTNKYLGVKIDDQFKFSELAGGESRKLQKRSFKCSIKQSCRVFCLLAWSAPSETCVLKIKSNCIIWLSSQGSIRCLLNDPTLQLKFRRGSRSRSRVLQQKMRATRYNKSFAPTAVRLLNGR